MSAPPAGERAAVERVRDRLDALGFNAAGVREALASGDDILSRARDIPVQVRRLRDAGPLGSVIRLFILDLPVPREEIASAFAPITSEELASLGLVRMADGDVAPLVRLVPHDDLLIASDVRLAPGQEAAHDHVPGVHRPSVTLSHMTVRRQVAAALDVGTGCGIEALLLARHADRVVATDVSARAIAYATFNALLNRVPNIETRVGSWFDPVRGERYATVVSNPPYVISPETQYVYRDSGLPGDSVSEQVIRAVPAHLEDGGFASVMISWIVRDPDDIAASARDWVEGSGCDAWILHTHAEDPLTAARRWTEQDALEPEAYGVVLDRWLAYFAKHRIPAITYGSVVLRRRDASPNWVRVDQLPQNRLRPASDHILRIFAAQDRLPSIDRDDALLEDRLALVGRHRVTQQLRVGEDGVESVSMELGLEEGVGFQASIDSRTLVLLEQLRGRTVRAALAAAAERLNVDEGELPRFITAGLPIVRQMYATGFLERRV